MKMGIKNIIYFQNYKSYCLYNVIVYLKIFILHYKMRFDKLNLKIHLHIIIY